MLLVGRNPHRPNTGQRYTILEKSIAMCKGMDVNRDPTAARD